MKACMLTTTFIFSYRYSDIVGQYLLEVTTESHYFTSSDNIISTPMSHLKNVQDGAYSCCWGPLDRRHPLTWVSLAVAKLPLQHHKKSVQCVKFSKVYPLPAKQHRLVVLTCGPKITMGFCRSRDIGYLGPVISCLVTFVTKNYFEIIPTSAVLF